MTTQETEIVQPYDRQVSSKSDLAKRGVHFVNLPTGGTAKIRIPDLHQLVAADALPIHLKNVALQRVVESMDGGPSESFTQETLEIAEGIRAADEGAIEKAQKRVTDAVALNVWLVSKMLVEPQYTEEELGPESPVRLPDEDLIFLVSLALRGRDTDAAGVKLGVAKIDDWATFRHEHECPEDCRECYAALVTLSTTGPVRL